MLCTSGFVYVFTQWPVGLCILCIMRIPKWQKHDSLNYCIDGNQILLNDKDE